MGLLDLLFKEKNIHRWLNHRNLYLLGLATIFCGLAWSHALMSIGQFILAGNWLIELNFKPKFQTLRNQKILWLLFSLYFIHIAGLLWTTDIDYALKDLRIKFPLFLLPLIIGTTEKLNSKELKALLGIYITTVLVISFASLYKLLGFTDQPIIDKRDLSIYISHIRYGLNIALASALCIYYRKLLFSKFTLFPVLISLWFILCLFLFELYSGLITLLPALLIINVAPLYKKKRKIAITATLILICLTALSSYTVISEVYRDYYKEIPLSYNQYVIEEDQKGVLDYTPNGEAYWHDKYDKQKVNGVFVKRFIALKEIKREWNKRSELDYNGLDRKGNSLRTTINRYMASKGLKKDSLSLSKLSDIEIEAIENGVANSYYLSHSKIENRIHKIIYEIDRYKRTANANGFSIAMRIEYWKTAWHIIEDNFWIGVGTGDINNAFHKQYISDNSLLDEQYRKRAHNQYLTFWATFGLLGLLLFVIYLLTPLIYFKGDLIIYLAFISIADLAFISEDTLETQAGVTFFTLFNTLFLLGVTTPKKTP